MGEAGHVLEVVADLEIQGLENFSLGDAGGPRHGGAVIMDAVPPELVPGKNSRIAGQEGAKW
jgi:hypothetical protein